MTWNKTTDKDNVSFKEKTDFSCSGYEYMENCYTPGFFLHNSLIKLGLDYSSAQTQIKIEMVNCTMLRGILEDSCTASVTTAPDKATMVLRTPTGQTAEKHLSGRAGDSDSQMNSLTER